MDKFNWCFIGVGGLANAVAKQILSTGRHNIVSCYRRNFEKSKQWAKKYNSTAYETAEEAIKAPDVDAVYVVTPHSNHAEYAKLALELGKPVLVEKPFTPNVKQTEEVFNLAKEKGLYVCEAMWTFFPSPMRNVMEWIQEGKIGKMKHAEAYFNVFNKQNPRVKNPMTAGGALLDLGVYPVTYMYRMFGMPKAIKCNGIVKNGVDHKEQIEMVYDGFSAFAYARIDSILYVNKAIFDGENGKIVVDREAHKAKRATLNNNEGKQVIFGDGTYINEFDTVAKEIREGKLESEYVPHQATLDVMKIMDECRKQMNLVYPFEK